MWDSYRLADSKELVAARWKIQKNLLKIKAYENKLKSLDPDTGGWELISAKLFEASELQKELIQKYWRMKMREM